MNKHVQTVGNFHSPVWTFLFILCVGAWVLLAYMYLFPSFLHNITYQFFLMLLHQSHKGICYQNQAKLLFEK